MTWSNDDTLVDNATLLRSAADDINKAEKWLQEARASLATLQRRAEAALRCRDCDNPLTPNDTIERDAANRPVCAQCWEHA